MNRVTVMGLGPMGAALARTLLRKKWPVTVWNRSIAKADTLRKFGAHVSPDAAAAVAASDVVLVCLADYRSANRILQRPAVARHLARKTLIQLSTGSPHEARESAAWASSLQIGYLDGALLVTPSQIGTPSGALLVAGDKKAYASTKRLLTLLAPHTTYLGTEAPAAAALDLAFLSHFFGGLLGFYHGARLMEAEGFSVTQLGNMIGDVAPALGEIVRHDARTIARDDFSKPESTLQNSATVMNLILRHARETGIDRGFPAYAARLFRRGIDAGYGGEDVAALMRILREPAAIPRPVRASSATGKRNSTHRSRSAA